MLLKWRESIKEVIYEKKTGSLVWQSLVVTISLCAFGTWCAAPLRDNRTSLYL